MIASRIESRSSSLLRGLVPCALLAMIASCSSYDNEADVSRWVPVLPDAWQEPESGASAKPAQADPARPRIVLPDPDPDPAAAGAGGDLEPEPIPEWDEEPQEIRRERFYERDADVRRQPDVPHSFFYVGGSYGRTEGGDSATTLQTELNRRTPGRNTTVELDDSDQGYKAYVGYRFAQPFAIELAYTGLEGSESTINAPTSDPLLVNDVKELHPVTGAGPSISFLGIPYDDGRWSVFGKIGLWFWESDVDVDLNGTRVERKTDDWDAILGVGLQCHLLSGLSVRAELERYLLRDTDVDVLSIGLNLRF